jgi:ribosomal protein S18 acetylase RimI-like enzyme
VVAGVIVTQREFGELRTIPPGEARERWVGLLELADEPEPVRRYLHDGTLHALEDDDGRPLAAILEIEVQHGACELRAVAVAEAFQSQGIGSWMISEVCERLRTRGARRVIVGTASSGVRRLAFYQRLGFRFTHVERDFFSEARGYPADDFEDGIRVRDMVWMDKLL